MFPRKLKSHTSTHSRQKNKPANRPSAHHRACLPHSSPECQKAVQWGVLQQRSAYGNDPADTASASTELEEMKPSRQNPDVHSLLYQRHCRRCFKCASHAKILALATKAPTPTRASSPHAVFAWSGRMATPDRLLSPHLAHRKWRLALLRQTSVSTQQARLRHSAESTDKTS